MVFFGRFRIVRQSRPKSSRPTASVVEESRVITSVISGWNCQLLYLIRQGCREIQQLPTARVSTTSNFLAVTRITLARDARQYVCLPGFLPARCVLHQTADAIRISVFMPLYHVEFLALGGTFANSLTVFISSVLRSSSQSAAAPFLSDARQK